MHTNIVQSDGPSPTMTASTGAHSIEQDITAAMEQNDFETASRLRVQQGLLAEFELLTLLALKQCGVATDDVSVIQQKQQEAANRIASA
eukprot:COSAG02_NODE_1917_length_10388_cov_116.704733_6_plen_89_part_00